MTTATTSTEQLAGLIAAKLQLVEILCRLARQQLALVEAGEMTVLVKLLAAKQTVLAQLQIVERQLAPYRDEDPEQRAWASAEERARCRAQAETCNASLGQLIELEKQAEAAMLRRRDAAATLLAGAQTAAEARSAYAPRAMVEPVTLQVEG